MPKGLAVLVIGVDPGSRYTGYGIVAREGAGLRHVASGRISAHESLGLPERLEIIYRGLQHILDEWRPEHAAMESIFTARNAMSSLKLGHARGVAMLALQHAGLATAEYAPALVKQAVAGHGRATKDQVQQMVRMVLNLRVELAEDASDGLAVAICHCHAMDFNRRLSS